jgi:hypothetical protein
VIGTDRFDSARNGGLKYFAYGQNKEKQDFEIRLAVWIC